MKKRSMERKKVSEKWKEKKRESIKKKEQGNQASKNK